MFVKVAKVRFPKQGDLSNATIPSSALYPYLSAAVSSDVLSQFLSESRPPSDERILVLSWIA